MSDTDKLIHLVEGFRKNLKNLKDSQTPEAVIRSEYIDEFWKLLGWDVNNSAHKSLAQKDVIIESIVGTVEEEKIRSRRPDYLFRIEGFPRFIVEAKKTAIDISTDKDAIFQAKTYAWSAQIPFAILTNFEQFRLFDTTIKPDHKQPRKGLIAEFDLRFEDYINQWDVLLSVFGRDQVAGASLEELLAKIKNVKKGRRIRGIDRMLIDLKGSEPVDKAFLSHLEDYRLRFAKDIYKENKKTFPEVDTKHGSAKLTEATQRLIDRIVFIRVCEDRNICNYGMLRNIVNRASSENTDLYNDLVSEFRNFDHKYNGYLFKAHFSEQVHISSELLRDFIESLYFPESPYRFEAIGDDILGIVYERFLGSVINLDKGHIVAEEKPEVRHAGGVYYTPKFVVDTIIRRVVGPKIKEKTPEGILEVCILDPACGSGSFLISALQYLYHHCIECFEKNPSTATIKAGPKSKTKTKKIGFQDENGNWHLTPDFKGQILSSCIYGVDIDGQAVEVTIMSLYLKMLQGEEPKYWQKDFLQSRLLPSLDNNIHCGNSLISQTDFDKYWENEFNDLFGGDEDIRFRINAFDWKSHTRGFGRIFDKKQGFDCIIGNPPYIRVQELNKWASEECDFYKKNYQSAQKGNYDIYVIFIEKGLQLLAPDGFMGYICPNKFWRATYGQNIRNLIAKKKHIKTIIDFTDQQVFKGATTYTAIHIFKKNESDKDIEYYKIINLIDGEFQCRYIESSRFINTEDVSGWKVNQPTIDDSIWSFVGKDVKLIEIDKASKRFPLMELVEFSQGFKTGADKVFVVTVVSKNSNTISFQSQETGRKHDIESSVVKSLIKSEHMRRYKITDSNLGVIFPYIVSGDKWRIYEPQEIQKQYPRLWNYLKANEEALNKREKGRFKGEYFYQYSRQQNFVPLSKTKLITPDMADKMRFSFDSKAEYVFSGGTAGGVCIIPKEGTYTYYLLGLLNSNLIENYVRLINGPGFRGGYLNCEIRFLRNIPVQLPRNNSEEELIGKIEKRVIKILDANTDIQKATETEQIKAGRAIESYEDQINELVCQLYGVDKIPE